MYKIGTVFSFLFVEIHVQLEISRQSKYGTLIIFTMGFSTQKNARGLFPI